MAYVPWVDRSRDRGGVVAPLELSGALALGPLWQAEGVNLQKKRKKKALMMRKLRSAATAVKTAGRLLGIRTRAIAAACDTKAGGQKAGRRCFGCARMAGTLGCRFVGMVVMCTPFLVWGLLPFQAAASVGAAAAAVAAVAADVAASRALRDVRLAAAAGAAVVATLASAEASCRVRHVALVVCMQTASLVAPVAAQNALMESSLATTWAVAPIAKEVNLLPRLIIRFPLSSFASVPPCYRTSLFQTHSSTSFCRSILAVFRYRCHFTFTPLLVAGRHQTRGIKGVRRKER